MKASIKQSRTKWTAMAAACALLLTGLLSGCSGGETQISPRKQKNVRVQMNNPCVDDDSSSSSSSAAGAWDGDDIDVEKIMTDEEWIEAAKPIYAYYAKKFGMKYPSYALLAPFYETLHPHPYNELASYVPRDKNLGGITYFGENGAAGEGDTVTPDKSAHPFWPGRVGSGDGRGYNYCAYDHYYEYIGEAVWYLSHNSPYQEGRDWADKGDIEQAFHAWASTWIGQGDYAGYILADREKFGLAAWDEEVMNGMGDWAANTGGGGENASPGSSGPTSTGDGEKVSSNVKITTHHQWQFNNKIDPTDDFPVDKYVDTGSHDGSGGNAANLKLDTSTKNDDLCGHGEKEDFKYIVLHSTESGTHGEGSGSEEAKRVISSVNNRGDGVSAHFYVGRDGQVFQHVSENLIAWHAGGHEEGSGVDYSDVPNENMNAVSIGIEIVHDQGDGAYPEEQLKAVDDLIAYLRGGSTSSTNNTNDGHKCNGTESKNKKDGDSGYNAKTGNEIADRALAEVGKDYVWGAVGPDGYDCSGLVSYAITGKHERLGTTYTFMDWPEVSDPKPGDICVNEGHTGVYIGDGQMCHAADYGIGVIVGPVQSGMKYVRYPG